MIWNDKRTPAGHVTDTTTGQTGPMQTHAVWGSAPPSGPGTWGHQPTFAPVARPSTGWGGHPTASATPAPPSGGWGSRPAAPAPVARPTTGWGQPSNLPPVDNSRLMNKLNDQIRSNGLANDAAARAPRVKHAADWGTRGVARALRRS